MSTTDDAVEAAARALHFFKTGAGWQDANPATVLECREQAESILRQAVPHLMRAAWDEGFAECKYDEVAPRPNPYRIAR